MKVRILLTALIAALLLIGVMVGYAAAQGPTPPPSIAPEKAAEEETALDAPQHLFRAGPLAVSYVYTNSTPLAIPDGGCPNYVTSTIIITDSFSIGDLNVGVWIAHTWRSDLDMYLQGPDGTTVELYTDPDGSADNINVLFDESSPNLADSVNHNPPPPYYYVTWNPEGNLDDFNFKNAQGTWTLMVCDDAGGDTGTLNTWTLFFRTGLILNPETQSDGACRGSDVAYTFEVINTTGVTQSFTLAYSSTWPVSGPPATGVIPANASETITVTVHIPWASNPGDTDTLIVTASGGGDSAQATATTLSELAWDWQDYANMPAGREVRAPSVVYYDGKLYVIGGYGYVSGSGAARPWLSIYDIASDSWTTGADMPAGRYWIDCEQLFDPNDNDRPKIYCAGGYLTSAQNTLYIYDIISDTWTTGPTLPANRYNYASVKLDNKYYVIGGYTTTYEPTMLVYDPATNAWDSSLAPMNVARRYFHAGAIGGQIYVAGGYNPTYLSSAEVYSPTADTWTYVASMPMPWVNGADGVKHDRFLVLAGGSPSSTSGASNGALVYDALTDTWNWLPLLDHLIYGAEGDIDGDGDFWYVSGRLYEGGTWNNSPYTTKLVQCQECVPVYGADFTVDPPVPRPGLPATFGGSVAGGSPPIAWTWDFGDNSTGSGQVVQHTYATTGTFTVVMTATNCDGANWVTVTHDVQVMSGPMIAVEPPALESTQCPDSLVTQTLSICNQGDQTLVFTITEVLTDIPWLSEDPTSGTVPPGGCQDVTVTFDSTGLAAGAYTGTLQVESNDILNPVVNVPVTLTVAGPPTNADFTWEPTPVILNTPVTFHGSADALVPVEYTWDFGDNNYGSGQDPSHTYTSWGDFTVVMTATACGQTDVATHTVTVLPCYSFVEEQFEGAFPPAGWEVVNNGGNCVWQRNDFWATPRPNYAGGQGYCADADSDKCGSGTTMDTELRTMVLDLSGVHTATLRYVTAYNDIGTGGDYADVDISTDGGATWTNLLRWDEDHDAYGPGVPVELDLTPYAGQNNVMVRFHYYLATYDWWWEVDQVNVFGCYVPGAVPDIEVTPTSLTQTLYRNQTAEQLLNIANVGLLALNYTLDEGCGAPVDWLALDPLAGTVPAQGDEDVTVSFDSTGLAVGTYNTTICVDSDDPDEPQVQVPVTLTVLPTPEIAVNPETLSAEQCADEVTTQTLSICNVGEAPLTWELREMPRSVQQGTLGPFVPPPVVERPVITSPEQCAAYENYTGVEPLGAAEFCHPDIVPVPAGGTAPNAPTDIGYALDIGYISDNFVWFYLNDFPGQTVVGLNATPFYGMDFDPTATTLYALNDTTDQLGTIDLATGAFTGLVLCPPPVDIWTGLTIDPVNGTFYGSTATSLYIIDPATGNSTLVGAFGPTLMIDIAMNMNGEMYGHDIGTDSIYSINPATGAATLIGPTGYAANYAQGMDFDNDDGTLYIFLYQGSGANVYGTVNLQTGAVTPLAVSNPLGEFEGAIQIPGFTGIPWLREEPITGTVPGGECRDVAVTFDSTGLDIGDYLASLVIDSNDPVNPQVVVPVTLTVLEPANNADFDWVPITPIVGQVVTFTATASGAEPLTYAWAFGDGDYGSGANPTHVYTEAGTYTVLLTVTNECGEAYATHDIVVVEGCVEPSGADFSWTPNEPIVGELVHFTGTVASGTGPFTYTWAFGDGAYGSGQTPSHTYDAAGDYTVVMTVSNDCGQDTATYVVHVVAACEPVTGVEFTWSPITPTVNLMALFTATVEAGTPPFTYTWDFGDGTGPVVITTPTAIHAYTATGTYTVTLVVENACGQAGAEHSLTVEALPPVRHYYYLPIITKGF